MMTTTPRQILGEKFLEQSHCNDTSTNSYGRSAEWLFQIKTPSSFSFGKKKSSRCCNELCTYYYDEQHDNTPEEREKKRGREKEKEVPHQLPFLYLQFIPTVSQETSKSKIRLGTSGKLHFTNFDRDRGHHVHYRCQQKPG